MNSNPEVIYSCEGEKKPDRHYTDFENSTYEIVSKVAYLVGVPKKFFDKESEPPKLEWFEKLDRDKNARIIRNLCMLRTAIERNYKELNRQMKYELKNLHGLPDLIPQECLSALQNDGISIVKANCKTNQYIIDINHHIANRINNCKSIFPLWIEWNYIRDLFLMPNGKTEQGIRKATNEYYSNRNKYPYQVYMNWFYIEAGNILLNDKKFVTLLYEANEDKFTDISKVSDAGNLTKDAVYKFLSQANRVAVVVDCENSDPFKLYAALKNLDQNALLSKVSKIILYDDVHTTTVWSIFEQFTDIPIEHIMIDRVKENKSLVDISLTTGTCREYYQNNIESFVLCSSDSDYWGLINAMPELRFLVMVESNKCGPDIKNALINGGYTFCYMDDFCTGNSNEIKIAAMVSELQKELQDALHLNVDEMLAKAFWNTRAEMTEAEEKQFYNKYIKGMRLVIAENGDLHIELGQ